MTKGKQEMKENKLSNNRNKTSIKKIIVVVVLVQCQYHRKLCCLVFCYKSCFVIIALQDGKIHFRFFAKVSLTESFSALQSNVMCSFYSFFFWFATIYFSIHSFACRHSSDVLKWASVESLRTINILPVVGVVVKLTKVVFYWVWSWFEAAAFSFGPYWDSG